MNAMNETIEIEPPQYFADNFTLNVDPTHFAILAIKIGILQPNCFNYFHR